MGFGIGYVVDVVWFLLVWGIFEFVNRVIRIFLGCSVRVKRGF